MRVMCVASAMVTPYGMPEGLGLGARGPACHDGGRIEARRPFAASGAAMTPPDIEKKSAVGFSS